MTLQTIWRHLTTPIIAINDREEAQKARLLAAICFMMTTISAPLYLIWFLLPDEAVMVKLLGGSSFGIVVACYFLSRYGYHTLAGNLVMGLGTLIVMGEYWFDADQKLNELSFMGFVIIFGSIFLHWRPLLAFFVVQLIAIAGLGMLRDTSFSQFISGPLSHHLIAGVMVFLSMYYRQALETYRHGQIVESREQYRSVFENSAIGVFHSNPMGHLTLVNQALADMLGYTPDELMAIKTYKDLFANPADHERLQNAFQHGKLNGIEVDWKRKSGESILVSIHARLRHNSEGDPLVCEGIVIDITERQQRQAQAMDLALEKIRVQILSNFLRDFSHEFRTPLSVIYMSTSMLRQAHQVASIDEIDKQVNVILKLVDTLVTMSRLDADNGLSLSAVCINTLLEILRTRLESTVVQHGLSFELKTDPTLCPIQADPNALMEAFKYILDNAIRHTQAGGNIRVHVTHTPDEIEIHFIDTGSGIDPEILPFIFQRFYRGDAPHQTRGLGLGLPIARKIVEGHGGHMEVESQPRQGSTFKVFLPYAGVN